MFHATFVAKHVKVIVETSILNHCNIEHLQKIKECNITNFHLQHWKKASTNLATSKNLHRNIMGYLLQHGKNIYKSCNIQKSPLKHHEIPIATWKKGIGRGAKTDHHQGSAATTAGLCRAATRHEQAPLVPLIRPWPAV
jgi:hypothetical protein